jgi:hypothetical protein
MSILAGENRTFSLNPCRVTLTAPEDCECERLDESNIKITLASLPECIIHLDIVQYDPRFGEYYSRNMRELLRNIHGKFGFDPDEEFNRRRGNFDSSWYRIMWQGSEGIGMDVWLQQYDIWMFRVMAAKLTEEESSHIRCLVKNLVVEI